MFLSHNRFSRQGCQMVQFHPCLGIVLRALKWKIFYGRLENLKIISYILCTLAYFIRYIFAVLVCSNKKNLATLSPTQNVKKATAAASIR
jgi:hypothetical protein